VLLPGTGLPLNPTALLSPSPGAPADLLLQLPATIALHGTALRPDGQDLAFVASAGPGMSLALAWNTTTRQFRLLSPQIGFAGTQTAYSPGGDAIFTFGLTATRFVGLETPQGVRFYTELAGDPWLF